MKKDCKDFLIIDITDVEDVEPKWYEAIKSTEITKEEVERAVFEKGYIADSIEISFDKKENIWIANGAIKDIERLEVGSYTITQNSSYTFEIAYKGAYSTEKKTICGGDLETILSTIFI